MELFVCVTIFIQLTSEFEIVSFFECVYVNSYEVIDRKGIDMIAYIYSAVVMILIIIPAVLNRSYIALLYELSVLKAEEYIH